MENCKTNYYRSGQDILLAFRVVLLESGEEALDRLLEQVITEIRTYADHLTEQLEEEHQSTLAAGIRWVRRELWVKVQVVQMEDGICRVGIQTSYGQLHAPAEISGGCEFEWNTVSNLCVKRIG